MSATTNKKPLLDPSKVEEMFTKKFNSVKSPMIRHLSSEGYDRGQIAKMMGIRYQHVRNVLITPIKKS